MVTKRTGKRLAAGLGALAFAFGFCLTASPAVAQTPVFPAQSYTVQPPFAADARNNISGANCADAEFRNCLAVNDATNFAQLFSVAGTTLRTGPIVAITTDRRDTAIRHAEGAAHDRGFFYVVTSRAKSLPGTQAATSFLVIRVPLDSGSPPATPGVVPGTEISEKIRGALTAGIAIPQLAGQQLTATNSDIEGVALKDGVIHLGFRAPELSGKAFIVSTPVAALFGSAPLDLTVHALGLGPNVGIHDLAVVSDGLLILAGPTRDLAGTSSLFHFNDNSNELRPVAEMVEPFDRKAKGLLVLQDDPEIYRVLVLFDGIPDGGPIDYTVPR